MSTKFREIYEATQAALRQAPDQAGVWYETQTRLGNGVDSTASVRQFAVQIDEPPALGGTDVAPSPVEYILVALGSCQEITYRLYADALGIPLNGVSVKLRALLDLRGFFAVDETVRPGFQRIEATVSFDSPASEQDLQRLKDTVDRHCPVLDILRNPLSVSLATARQQDAAHAAA